MIVVSSAYNLILLHPIDLQRSLIYNNKLPSTDPCGTPHNAVRKPEFTSFMTVYWSLLVMKSKEIIREF